MELLERVISAPDRDWAQLALPVFVASTVIASISTHGCRGPYQIFHILPLPSPRGSWCSVPVAWKEKGAR